MEVTIVFWLFLLLVSGGGMLVLYMSYLSIEEKRAEVEREGLAHATLEAQTRSEAPVFFSRLDANQVPLASHVFDDVMLAHLEGYLESEQAMVAQFVDEPSIANLYRQKSLSENAH